MAVTNPALVCAQNNTAKLHSPHVLHLHDLHWLVTKVGVITALIDQACVFCLEEEDHRFRQD